MNVGCPNCSELFAEHYEMAYRCKKCGWLRQVDGVWGPCPEPVRQVEPPMPADPMPAEPIVPAPADNVRSYLGGLVTVTTEDDEDDPQ